MYDPIGPWQKVQEAQSLITNVTNGSMPKLNAAAPNSYAYMNEANIEEKNWKKLCYGPNYLELLRLKRKWDPEHRLYAVTGVGSDEWGLRANGRLCKA